MRRSPVAMTTVLVLLGLGCNPPPPNTDLCKGRQAGDLVITEVMADPDGTDSGGEWFELFNTLGSPLDLKGLQVYVKKGDGTGLKTHSLRAGTVGGRASFTLGDVRTGPNPTWLDYSYADALGALGQSDFIIGVRCGTLVLDEIHYTKAAKPGRSHMLDSTLDPDAVLNDDETRWCDTPVPNDYGSGINAGTPRMPNPLCPSEVVTGTCLENGTSRAVVQPALGELVITEAMADPKAVADTTGEWLEVQGKAGVDLNGLVLVSGAGKTTFSSSQCLMVGNGQYVLLAKNGDAGVNGELPPALATFTVSLSNAGGPVGLYLGDGGLVDVATLPKAVAGFSWQLNPAQLTAAANDSEASFCLATQRWLVDGGVPDGGDYGTPGAANTACPVAPNPDECVEPATGRTRLVVRPDGGDVVITEFMADPSAVSDTAGEWFELLVTRAVDLNGLKLGNEGAGTSTVTSQTCLSVPANSYVVFGHSADPLVNGGLPELTATFDFALANSGARLITVKDPLGVELDRLAYSSVTPGASTQLKPGLVSPADNDVSTNLCATPASSTYGGDRGTPGAPNVACP